MSSEQESLDAGEEFEDLFDESESFGSGPEAVTVSATIQQYREMLRKSCKFFIQFFLHDQIDSETPEFHLDIWSKLTDVQKERVLLAIPRDHAKTTLAKLCVVWYFLFTGHRFCVYLSNTNSIAKNACKDIIGFIKSDNFIAVFGRVVWVKESDTDSLWIFELQLPNGRTKRCILRAVGAGQQMRGINIDNQRPDIAVVDDVEDNENTESLILQKKLDRWIFGPFIKALARNRRKIIWLGNMLQKTSLLARLSRNPRWNPVVFGAIIKDAMTGALKSLWPERWPLDELQTDFKEYRDLGLVETWLCEMMNMPGHGVNGFNAAQINYEPSPTPDGIRAAFLVLDPAFGLQKHNDDSSITVHVIPDNGPPMVVAHLTGKMTENQIFDNMLAMARYWNAWVWGIEAIAAQRVLIPFFNLLIAAQQLNHQVEMLPLMSGRGDPKHGRISAWVSAMQAGEYAIADDDIDITTQLMAYNPSVKDQKDDLVDSCAYGPQMIDNYLHLILAQTDGSDPDEIPAAQYGRKVAGV